MSDGEGVNRKYNGHVSSAKTRLFEVKKMSHPERTTSEIKQREIRAEVRQNEV